MTITFLINQTLILRCTALLYFPIRFVDYARLGFFFLVANSLRSSGLISILTGGVYADLDCDGFIIEASSVLDACDTRGKTYNGKKW